MNKYNEKAKQNDFLEGMEKVASVLFNMKKRFRL